MRWKVICHSRLSGIILKLMKKDAGQAGMTSPGDTLLKLPD
jgi:hypothetical protein